MSKRIVWVICLGVLACMVSGCLYRSDGVFKKIGDSDYKANINIMNMFVVADGGPVPVCGTVLLEDGFTPLKFTRVMLRKKGEQALVSHTQTDHSGKFLMSGTLLQGDFAIEIESLEYSGNKVITVDPGRRLCHNVIAYRK